MSATVSCPHCNGKIVADPRIAGREVGCPHCNGRVIMPTAQAPKPALPAQPVQQAPSGLTTIDPLDFLDAPSAPNRNAGYSTGYAPPPTTYGSYGSQNKRKTVSPLVWIIPAIIVGLLMIGWVGARQFGGGTITFAESVDSSTLRTTNEGNHFSTGLVPMVIRGNGSFGSSTLTSFVRNHGAEAWHEFQEWHVDPEWDVCAKPILLDRAGTFDIKVINGNGRTVATGTVYISG